MNKEKDVEINVDVGQVVKYLFVDNNFALYINSYNSYHAYVLLYDIRIVAHTATALKTGGYLLTH